MSARATPALLGLAIAVVAALLYLRSLDYVPPYLIHDEAQGALQAHSIATTGHDLTGRLLPLYFTEPEFPPGRDPALIYVTALGLQILPFTEAGARTPTTLVAVLNIVLMFFAARALFHSTWAGVLAAVLLMLSPVHFIRGRLLLSPLYSIPFVLAWLWTLARFAEQPTARRFAAACVWLALGMYSYLAAVVMMPLYLLMSIGIAMRPLRARSVLIAAVVMTLCLLPMAAWYLTHPERNAQIVSAYQLAGDDGPAAVQSVLTILGNSVHLYWSFFDPSYLFVSGDASLVNSTRTSGLFPIAFVALIPIGLVALVRSGQPLRWVIAAGFLTAPVVSIMSGAIEMNRVMFAVPFTVLVATSGVVALIAHRSTLVRIAAILLVSSVAWQFAGFHRSYFSDTYRLSAATWFSGAPREALRELIARADNSPIFISQEIEWVHRMWRFYAIEAGRLDLIDRTTYFREVPGDAPRGAKLICAVESVACITITASPAWRSLVTVPSIDGSHRYVIFERLAAGDHGN